MHESKNHEPFAHLREVWSLLSISVFRAVWKQVEPIACDSTAVWNGVDGGILDVVVQASCGLHVCLLNFVAVHAFGGEATFRFLLM